jgi:hypothetical protein
MASCVKFMAFDVTTNSNGAHTKVLSDDTIYSFPNNKNVFFKIIPFWKCTTFGGQMKFLHSFTGNIGAANVKIT